MNMEFKRLRTEFYIGLSLFNFRGSNCLIGSLKPGVAYAT